MSRSTVRVLALASTVAIAFVASRAIVRSLPGDPLDTLIAETGTELPREELRAELGLDRPFAHALLVDAGAAMGGNFGRSILSRHEIGPLLWERLQRTALLVALAVVVGAALALPLGLLACHGALPGVARAAGNSCTLLGAVTAALPTPWTGPMLAYGLSYVVPVFPLGGHVALPALTLALPFAGFWARLIRERVRETLRTGSARGARARGVGEAVILLKYGLAPASGSLLAYFGTQIGSLLAGAFVTEVIFDWPGMGALLVESVLKRDYPVVEAAVFAAAVASVAGTALGDLARATVDPRPENR